MNVCHYARMAEKTFGGPSAAIQNQRTALERAGVPYTTDPSEDHDILHLNLPSPQAIIQAKRARRKGTKVVIHTHHTEEDFRDSFRFSNLIAPVFKRYITYFYQHADLLICPTEYNQDIMRSYGFENTTVISNGLDPQRFDGYEQRREQARERFGVSGDVVFCVGSVFMRKAPDTFIEVARSMPETDFIWFGTIMNSMFLTSGTDSLIEQAPDNVQFTGHIEDIRDAFAAGDIYFYPTREENQGIPSLEAAYCHRPVILRDIPVFEEYFTNGQNCLKAETVDGFREQIEQLMDDDGLRKTLTTTARETAEDHTLKEVGKQLHKAYQHVLEG